MKKTMLIATFMAVGAGSAGVSALDNVNPMLGSDTLKEFTLAVLDSSVCPGAFAVSPGIVYTGGGSGGGETALVASPAKQTVAPMSRFLAAPTVPATATAAEGIAFAADGVALAISKAHAACDTNPGTSCTATLNTGLRNSGTLNGGAYTLGAGNAAVQGWRDVLRLVFLGLPGTAGKDPNVSATGVRDCASAVRTDLVNTYGNLFQDANCGTGGCTQLTHAWRRDLLSGTTDVFRELINAKLYPFCNNRFVTDTNATDYSTVLSTGAPLFDDAYMDFDPIRRTCVGGSNGQGGALPAPTNNGTVQPDFPATVADQVCGPKGTLGLVLPVRTPTSTTGDLALSDVHPTKPCLRGTFNLGPAPKVPGSPTKDTLCPNGDVPLGNLASDYNPATGQVVGSSGLCLIPSAADGDSQCINGKNNLPAVIDPPDASKVASDGRVYNLHVYGPGSTPVYKTDIEIGHTTATSLPRQIVGAFTRIHSTRTLLTAGPTCPGTGSDKRCCAHLDSTDQIGCLSEADACSIGFAGGPTLDAQLQTSATLETNFGATVNGVANTQSCIVTETYPLSRKVYINSVVGFENVTGNELALAKCFAGGIVGAPTTFNNLILAKNLFPLPAGPACKEFVTGSNACANNPTGIPH